MNLLSSPGPYSLFLTLLLAYKISNICQYKIYDLDIAGSPVGFSE